MSAKKYSNFLHRSQTLIPRPPYKCQPLLLGFVQRVSISFQLLYAPVWLRPCFLPQHDLQLLEPPLVSWYEVSGVDTAPHAHRHSQVTGMASVGTPLFSTVQPWKTSPMLTGISSPSPENQEEQYSIRNSSATARDAITHAASTVVYYSGIVIILVCMLFAWVAVPA